MDKNLETLIKRGAECVAGDIILRGKSMGRLKNGVFAMSDDGEQELNVIDVDAEPQAKPAQAIQRPTRKPKPRVQPGHDPEVELNPVENLDDLLADD